MTTITIANISDTNTTNIASNAFLKSSAFTISLVSTAMGKIFFK